MRKSSVQQSQIERVECDQQQIKKKSAQLKDKLFLGHQKSQSKYKNGIVFIGNSRVGKSTLAAILNGIEMRKRLNGNMVVIQPLEEQYRNQANLIQHSFTSVTSYPNIKEMQIDGQYYTIVDLPGFMDTSYQKQLCNWAYIKNILQQLQKILFVMVLHVHSQNFTIKDDELSMMKRFKQAFPTSEKFKPKENLCMIVNFVQGIETQQKEVLMKERIIKEMQKQLNKDMELNSFYMKSLEKSRVLVIERARKDENMSNNTNNNNNQPYTIPKLFPFIKSNLNKLMPPQASQHKLNLSISNNKKSQQLREIIRYLMQSTLQQISQRINEYKVFLSQVFSILSQTAGAELGKQNIVRLENYQFKKKLTKYGKIQLPKQIKNYNNLSPSVSVSQSKQQQKQQQQHISSTSSSTSIQEIIFTIIQILNEINSTKFEQTKHGLNNLLQKTLLFYKYIEKLASKLFTNNQQLLKQFLSITDNIKKSIYIDCLDMICLNENVQDFLVPIDQNEQVGFYQLMKDALFDTYDSIIRISTFKQSLKKYIDNLLRQYQDVSKQSVGVNKVDIGTLKRLATACQLTNLKQSQLKAVTLRYIIEHKKVKNVHFINNLNLLHNVLRNINNNYNSNNNNNNNNNDNQLQHQRNYTKQQQQQIQKWKHQNQQQWQSIKGKNFIFMLNLLTKTGYENKKQLLRFYLDLNTTTQYEQILRLLKQLINEDVQQNKCDRFTAYELCMEAKEKMLKDWEIQGAMACCKLAEKLYVYQDKKRFLQARKQYMELVKLSMMRVQQQQKQKAIVMNTEMNDYIQGLSDRPWGEITDELYNKLIQTVDQHCVSVILANKQKLMSSQSLSSQQHIHSSHNKNNNNVTIVNMNRMFSSPGQMKKQIQQQQQQKQMMTQRQSITKFSQNTQKVPTTVKTNNDVKIANGSQNKKVQNNNISNSSINGGQSPPQPQKKLRGFKTFK